VAKLGGALECVCKVHTHLIPVRDYARFNQAVTEATKKVLDQPLAQIVLSLSANHPPGDERSARELRGIRLVRLARRTELR
jgi:hypothetical protein